MIGAQKDGPRIGVVGLGYVGLPLAVAFGRQHDTVGFDINEARVQALRGGVDSTQEMSAADLAGASHLRLSSELEALRGCNTYIVTVPTPIDAANRPDLRPLKAASEALGSKHRLENPGKQPLELIEVQSGSYLGEDDIVRFEDVYGRSAS